MADEEEHTGDVFLLEHVEDRLRPAVFVAAVEGEIDDVFIGMPSVDRAVFVEQVEGILCAVPLIRDLSCGQIAFRFAGVPRGGVAAVGKEGAGEAVDVGEIGQPAAVGGGDGIDVLTVFDPVRGFAADGGIG